MLSDFIVFVDHRLLVSDGKSVVKTLRKNIRKTAAKLPSKARENIKRNLHIYVSYDFYADNRYLPYFQNRTDLLERRFFLFLAWDIIFLDKKVEIGNAKFYFYWN